MAEPSKLHALLEGVLELGRGDGERLELAEHVGEPEPDQPDPALLDRAQHVVLLAFHGAAMMAGRAAGPDTRLARARSHSVHTRETAGKLRRWPSVRSADTAHAAPDPLRGGTGDALMAYKAEYIWVDGTEPTAKLRSKTKILDGRRASLPIWGFDGSSTNQAPGRQLRLRAAAGVRRARTRSAAATTSSSCARCCSPT